MQHPCWCESLLQLLQLLLHDDDECTIDNAQAQVKLHQPQKKPPLLCFEA